MKITCENCHSVFDLPPDKVWTTGCPFCEHINRPPKGATPPAGVVPPPPPPPPPGSDADHGKTLMALADALLKDESDTVRKAVSGKAQALPDRHLITVVILEGDGKGQRFQLKKSSNVVGRKMNCEVWLTDSEVSRKHCIIEVYGDTVILKDAGSINGTVFNNQVIKEVILKHEDRFQVGGTVLQLLITPKT